jgi:hypothetical protein
MGSSEQGTAMTAGFPGVRSFWVFTRKTTHQHLVNDGMGYAALPTKRSLQEFSAADHALCFRADRKLGNQFTWQISFP